MFSIPVRLQGVKGENAGFYTYQIEASVTNQAGETQSSVTTLSAGNRSLVLSVETEERICKDDSIRLTFVARNLNMQPVAVKGDYRLVQTVDGKQDSLPRMWKYCCRNGRIYLQVLTNYN